jgi:hypothetical protein
MTTKPIVEKDGVCIYEMLTSNDAERLEAMLALYAQFFPEYEQYVPRMRRRAAFPADKRPGHLTHYWLFEYEGKPVGLTTFRYIVERECGLGVSFAIDNAARKIQVGDKRLSAFIIDEILAQLKKDAAKTGTDLYGLVTEVEHRSLMEHYKKMGMLELPMKYFEPIYQAEDKNDDLQSTIEKIKFIPVILAITPAKKFDLSPVLLKNFAKAFLVDHYDLPENHHKVQETLNSIQESAKF